MELRIVLLTVSLRCYECALYDHRHGAAVGSTKAHPRASMILDGIGAQEVDATEANGANPDRISIVSWNVE